MSNKFWIKRDFGHKNSPARNQPKGRRTYGIESLEERRLLTASSPTAEFEIETVEISTATDDFRLNGLEESTSRQIVELTDSDLTDSILNELGEDATLVRSLTNFPIIVVEAPEQAFDALRDSPHVVSMMEDVAVPPTLASTVPLIRANETTARGFAGNGVSVVILDTGIDGDHDFFGTNGSRIVEERCFSNAGGAGGRVSLCPNGENVDDDAEVETPFARLVGSISATTVPTWLELQREVESPMPLPRLMEWRQEQASSLCRFSRGLTTPPVVPSVHPVSDPLAAIK